MCVFCFFEDLMCPNIGFKCPKRVMNATDMLSRHSAWPSMRNFWRYKGKMRCENIWLYVPDCVCVLESDVRLVMWKIFLLFWSHSLSCLFYKPPYPDAVLFTGWRRRVLAAHTVRMATLWYNLPNYLLSILPCIIPLFHGSVGGWDCLFLFFFPFLCMSTSNSCIH